MCPQPSTTQLQTHARPLYTLAHSGVVGLACDPWGRWVTAGAGAVTVWRHAERVHALQVPCAGAIAWSPRFDRLLTSDGEHTALIALPAEGPPTIVARLEGRARFTSSGELLLTRDGQLVFYHIATGTERLIAAEARAFALSPKDELIVMDTIDDEGDLILLDLIGSEVLALDSFGTLHTVSFNATGDRLCALFEDALAVWSIDDPTDASLIAVLDGLVEEGHFAWAPDGRSFVVFDPVRGQVRLFDADGRRIFASEEVGDLGGYERLEFTPGGTSIIAVADEDIQRWRVTGGRCPPLAVNGPIHRVLYTRDDKRALTAAHNQPHPQLWDVHEGESLATLEVGREAEPITAAAFSLDEQLLAVATSEQVHVFDSAMRARWAM